jgi:GrpB-like predicted nucleotidyltransferase (UPF0157 family)
MVVMMGTPVVIVDYDPQWPRMYEEERARIRGAIGHLVVAIEHIGSTAVPGLGAKPIIDVMVAVRHLDDARECIEPLTDLGYEYVPEYEEFIPDRRYFRTGPTDACSHHLHMVAQGNGFWETHILFRDCLRTCPEEARRYDRLKRDLAARFGADREGYTDAKTAYIESVVAKARASKATNAHQGRET